MGFQKALPEKIRGKIFWVASLFLSFCLVFSGEDMWMGIDLSALCFLDYVIIHPRETI